MRRGETHTHTHKKEGEWNGKIEWKHRGLQNAIIDLRSFLCLRVIECVYERVRMRVCEWEREREKSELGGREKIQQKTCSFLFSSQNYRR
jgi:hypothetical protein